MANRPPYVRAAARRFAATAVLAVVGIVLVAVGDTGHTVWIVGATLLGLAAVLATAFVFLEVGYSEDRDRARRGPG